MGEPKIFIKESNRLVLIYLKDISHIICSGYICTLHTKSAQFVVSKLLKEFEKELSESNFIRINHSTLINVEYIENIKFGKGRMATLSTGVSIKVSRRKIHIVSELLQKKPLIDEK
jgi:two-component system LytT family response regulator